VRFSRLEISWFRNLSHVAMELAPGLNIFFGDNGAGKTALLEAVHVLCRGRSFRTQNTRGLIQQGAETLVVRALIEDELRGPTSLAISKNREARTELKLNGVAERRLSEVARLTPLQVMLPNVADLVFGGPAGRRSWLDWGTFHVKPEYMDRLRDYLRAVRQRNALLKDGGDARGLVPWNDEVARLAEAVTQDRVAYLETLVPHFGETLGALAPELHVELRYHRGWPQDRELRKLLGDSSPREVKYGSTLWGPHRADVQLRTEEGAPAGAVLSRGQGKMVASALQIAQAALLAERESRSTAFLIDDAGAELDAAHNQRFYQLLDRIGGQILATTTRDPRRESALAEATAGEIGVFHVEHGSVTRIRGDEDSE
jgi:DNA replication and repair protein RecF